MRGLSASYCRSASRLKAIAAERAVAMQTRMPIQSCERGRASRLAHGPPARPQARANGSANKVWLNRIRSRY